MPVLIYSGMSENVQSFKRKREREDKRKRKRERERVDRLDAICKRKIKERERERERVRVKCFRNDCRSDRLFTLHLSGRIPGL